MTATVDDATAAAVREHLAVLNAAGWSWAAVAKATGIARASTHRIATDPTRCPTPEYARRILAIDPATPLPVRTRAPNGTNRIDTLICPQCGSTFELASTAIRRRFCKRACVLAAASSRYADPARDADIVRRYLAGETLATILAGTGKYPSQVLRIIRAAGVPLRGMGRYAGRGAVGSGEHDKALKARYVAGASLQGLATEFCTGTATVRSRLVAQGVTIRARSGRG